MFKVDQKVSLSPEHGAYIATVVKIIDDDMTVRWNGLDLVANAVNGPGPFRAAGPGESVISIEAARTYLSPLRR